MSYTVREARLELDEIRASVEAVSDALRIFNDEVGDLMNDDAAETNEFQNLAGEAEHLLAVVKRLNDSMDQDD